MILPLAVLDLEGRRGDPLEDSSGLAVVATVLLDFGPGSGVTAAFERSLLAIVRTSSTSFSSLQGMIGSR